MDRQIYIGQFDRHENMNRLAYELIENRQIDGQTDRQLNLQISDNLVDNVNMKIIENLRRFACVYIYFL